MAGLGHKLEARQGQGLVMTPQLQQAIKLLQLSTLELQLEIQNMLESNPMLESDEPLAEPGDNFSEGPNYEKQADDDHSELSGEQFEQYHSENMLDYSPKDISEEITSDPNQHNVDQSSESLYFENIGTAKEVGAPNAFNLDEINSSEYSLSEYLLAQLNLCKMTERDQNIAYLLIESLDQRGYLRTSIEQLVDILNDGENPESPDESYEADELLAVLHRIQQFEPTGIAAQNLQECLLLQLAQIPEQTYIREATELVKRYLNYLGTKDFIQIRRKTRFSENTLSQALKLIQSLNPNPASLIQQDKTEYIIPDIIIKKQAGQWIAELNENSLPKIRINEFYASLLNQKTSKNDKQFLKNNLQEARWFIKSLHSRHETLLKVAREILRVQQDFFEIGEEAMKPLVLHDIAELVDMHESTISRVTTQKYMLSPKGIFELKYFFSSHVGSEGEDEYSSTAIRAHIKKLVSAEDRKKPLSDSKISSLLSEQGIKVARRTIAKYRESLSIPPSNERKRLL